MRSPVAQSRIIFREPYRATAFSTEHPTNACSSALTHPTASPEGDFNLLPRKRLRKAQQRRPRNVGTLQSIWTKTEARAAKLPVSNKGPSQLVRAGGGTNTTTTEQLGILHQHRKIRAKPSFSKKPLTPGHSLSLPARLFYLNLPGQRPCQPRTVISISFLLPPASLWSGSSAATPRCQLDVIINKVIDYLPRAALEPADKLGLAPVL